MNTRMVTVVWKVEAEIEANVPVSDADVREWLGESEDYEVTADDTRAYAADEADESLFDLKEITYWEKIIKSEVKEQA